MGTIGLAGIVHDTVEFYQAEPEERPPYNIAVFPLTFSLTCFILRSTLRKYSIIKNNVDFILSQVFMMLITEAIILKHPHGF